MADAVMVLNIEDLMLFSVRFATLATLAKSDCNRKGAVINKINNPLRPFNLLSFHETREKCKLFPDFCYPELPVNTILMNLLLATALLLISAVAVGFYLVFIGLRQRKRLPGLGLAHAGLALAGILVLFTEIFTGPTDKLNNLAALFLLFAIVGGGMVLALHEENKPPSMAAVTAHAVMGVIGLTLVIINLL